MNSKTSNVIKSSFVILLLIVSIMSFCQPGNHDCVITNVTIVDVKTGKILKNKTIAIDNNRIAAIYDKEIVSSDSTIVIDGKGKYLIPGLWDMHAHHKLGHEDLDPLLIANGITGVREMWDNTPEFVKVPEKTQPEGLVSPDVYLSGDLIDGNPPNFSGSLVVTTPEEAVNAAQNQIDKKVDFIKVYSNLSEECFLAIAKEAKKMNIPFAGHIPNRVSIYTAIEAGMVSSKHLYGFLNACSSVDTSNEALICTFSESRFDSLCTVLAKSSMWICPTLTVNRSMSSLNDSVFINDNRIAYIPEFILEMWNQMMKPYTKGEIDKFANTTSVSIFLS